MRCCLTPGFLLSTALLLLGSPAAATQAFPTPESFWEVTPQAGIFVAEEPEEFDIETGPLFGARGGYRSTAGFGVELHAAFAPLDMQVFGNPPEPLDLTAFIYGIDGLYSWAIDPRSDFFLALGGGAVTWSADREGEGGDLDSETNLRISVGVGAHYLLTSSIALRGDLRDHIIFDSLEDTARALAVPDEGTTNNLEVSVGASFVLP